MNHCSINVKAFIAFFLFSVISFGQTWKEFKSFEGTTTNCIAYHPNGRLFLSTMEFGIFISDDEGRSWVNSLANSSTRTVDFYQDIVIDLNGNVFVNATGRKAIMLSSDRGNTWNAKPIPGPSDNIVYKIATDSFGNIYVGTKGKIYISNDLGTSWKLIFDYGSNLMIQQIEIHNGIIFATVDQIGFYISTDMGKTWKYKWLPQSSYRAMAILNEKEFFISCFMELELPFIYSGVLYTNDGGNTWLEVNDNIGSVYFSSMEVLSDGSVLAGADYGKVYKSKNKGLDWELLTAGTMTTNINSITIKDEKIFCGSFYSGLIKSTDNGKTWDFSNKGLGQVRTYSIQKLSNGDFFVANSAGAFLYDSKNQKYIPRSLFYYSAKPVRKEHNKGSQPRDIKVYSDKEIYCSSYSGGIYHTTDLGITWKQINTNTNSSGVNWLFKTDNNSLFFESLFDTKGLYQSLNNNEWKLINSSFRNISEPIKDNLNNYYTTDMFYIYKSTDNGASWKTLNNLQYLLGMGYYINTDNTIYALTTNGLYSSKDTGETWSQIKNTLLFPLANKTTQQIAVVGKDKLLCATDVGIYKSNDSGLNWEFNADELWGKQVLKFHKANDGSLYAILGNSIYKYEQTTAIEKNDQLPSEYKLSQNYPNPFNPSTTIDIAIVKEGRYSLKVYNILGQEVAEILNKEMKAGNHKVMFDASRIASGMYIYKLSGSNVNLAKKMLLLK